MIFANRNFLALQKSVLQRILTYRKQAPWIASKIVSAICKCSTCYQQTGSIELMNKYEHFRKKFVHMVKREYLGNLKSASGKNFESVEY